MAKREQRWPIWKIVLVTVGLMVAATGLFVTARHLGPDAPVDGDVPPPNPDTSADYTMSNMLMLFGAICSIGVLICVGWLVVRYYQSIPAWKKRAKLPAHRRK